MSNKKEIEIFNFESSINYDYESIRNCAEHGCRYEKACRCVKIEDFTINYVDMTKLCGLVYELLRPKFDLTPAEERDRRLCEVLYGGQYIDEYCIDRIARYYKLYNVGLWKENTSNSYYGEEFNGIFLEVLVYKDFITTCEEVISYCNLEDKLRFLLKMEYGVVLDNLKDAEFELISIYISDIDFDRMNQEHIKNIKNENLEYYSSDMYMMPRGIVRKQGDKYLIIDGYHRILNAGDGIFKAFCKK